MVGYVLDIATEMHIENVYAIMLPDNYRALSLTKKMGFELEYLGDGTVKGTLSLKEELPQEKCEMLSKLPEPPQGIAETETTNKEIEVQVSRKSDSKQPRQSAPA